MAKHTSLLLLPPPPTDINPASLSAAYKSPLLATISTLKSLMKSTELQVVVPCPSVHSRLHGPRSRLWGDAQQLLANFYSLFCIVCAALEVDVDSDTPGSIDARVLLLDYDGTQVLPEEYVLDTNVAGPIISLAMLALARRRWDLIFSADGEAGQKILAEYTTLANNTRPPLSGRVHTVSGGLTMIRKDSESPESPLKSSLFHKVVAVGGTFDHLHAGHKLLLTATALLLQPANKTSNVPRRLIVGITGDELLKNKKYAEYLGSWKQRQNDVVNFLLSILSFTRLNREEEIEISTMDEPVPNGKAIHTTLKSCSITIECVEIQDPFGPTITDESVTALVVSGETKSGGQAVNDKRVERGWAALEIFEVDVLDADELEDNRATKGDFGSKISSTAIRKRIADSAPTSSL